MPETVIIDRDYIDNFSVKEYCENTLIPKYFPDVDISLRTVGMIGYVTELITNYGEDTFNTGSVLFRETFPNRAEIDESIYSHAAIFQLDYVFSSAASCRFLLILDEETIINNMVNYYDKSAGIYHFYIDKNTEIYIENTPYTLDYDIQMDIIKKSSVMGDEYLFSAKYILSEFKNSISDIKDPYVKVRRSKDGFIALEVMTHQCIRDVYDETIITNGTINYPTLDIPFDDSIAGFDILYKAPDSDHYVQMKKLLVYSQPTSDIFCYYQIVEEGLIRITFNSKDNYFKPDFNSDIQVIMYKTKGLGGNFDVYNGTNIAIVTSEEKWAYDNSFLVAAKPVGASAGGASQMGVEPLQAYTVENYRTATALTTENDLHQYFNNYKYKHGDSNVLFIKKRDDVYERVYSAFLIIHDGIEKYKTNTLNLKLNLSDMKLIEKDTYILEPGWLFTSNEGDGYAQIFRDPDKYNDYYQEYLEAVAEGTIPFIEDKSSEIPAYLDRPASFAEFKRRHGLDDKVSVFDLTEEEMMQYDAPLDSKFLYTNPFLIYFTKSPNLVSTYMTYVRNTSLLDFTNQNDDSFIQFTIYTLNVKRAFSKSKTFNIDLTVTSTILLEDKHPVIHTNEDKTDYIFGGRFDVVNNDLRIVMVINDGKKNICYTELYPVSYDSETTSFKFVGSITTTDYITSDGRLRIKDEKIYRFDESYGDYNKGDYFKVHDDDNTLYDLLDENNVIRATDIPVDRVTELYEEGHVKIWINTVNMTQSSYIDIPMEDVDCKVYTLYSRVFSEEIGDLVPVTSDTEDNIFIQFDERYKNMIWTNEYSSITDMITFMQPLNSVRTSLTFEDFTSYHEIPDPEPPDPEPPDPEPPGPGPEPSHEWVENEFVEVDNMAVVQDYKTKGPVLILNNNQNFGVNKSTLPDTYNMYEITE